MYKIYTLKITVEIKKYSDSKTNIKHETFNLQESNFNQALTEAQKATVQKMDKLHNWVEIVSIERGACHLL
jgi:hypothetical protein